MTRGRRLAGPRLSVAALAAAAALTFGAGASADETCPAEEIPQPVSVELARQQQRPEKAEKTEKAPDKPCLFRDPDDGACYPSADAADRAWLAAGLPAKAKEARPSMFDARVAAASANSNDADVEDDPDADDAEDGGSLAPVDSLLPAGRVLPSFSELRKPEKPSLWANMVRKMKRLVVRKTDSRPVSLPEDDLNRLFETGFPIPVEDLSRAKFRDSFDNARGRHRRHHAIDLPAPHGTPVVAVVDGVVERLGRDRRGGKVAYLRDTSGKFVFYYAHLASHAAGLRVGDTVKRGTKLGKSAPPVT